MIFVFDFRAPRRHRGPAGNAPINGLLAAINKSLLDYVGKQPQFVRLIFFVQSQIWVFPISKNSEAFELRSLLIDEAARKNVAGLADRRRIGCAFAFLAHLLVDRSEEHTSELQSRLHLVCRLL